MREQIVNKAIELFFDYGFKTTTTSELAKALGISKKTLYEYYPSKEAIILDVLAYKQAYFKRMCRFEDSENVIADIFEKMQEVLVLFKANSSRAVWELQKYYPSIAADFDENFKSYNMANTKSFITQGIKQGFFRADVDIDFMVYFHFGLIKMQTNPSVFPEGMYSLAFLVKKNLEHFVRILCNERGLEELEKVKKNYIRQ